MIKYLCLVCVLFAVRLTYAQATKCVISGTIQNTKGEWLTGATITATYLPSGSVYSALSDSDGQFTIARLKPGGPYRIRATFVGYIPAEEDNINIGLDTPAKIDIVLKADKRSLVNVNVNASKGDIINPANIGTSTLIMPRELQALPVVSGTFVDLARLTPQANPIRGTPDATPLGISYAGQNNKYNRFTIDGAKAVNAFDLYANGASINPLPSQSIQAFQILLSPYDVVYGRFLGGDVNVITKSGGDQFHGSAYGYFQDQSLFERSIPSGINRIFGADLGGPLIKNKLFFFANIESVANSSDISYDPSESGSGSKFDPAVLQGLVNYVEKKYDVNIGSFSAIRRTVTSASAFARLDWIIDNKNKLIFRNSYVNGENFAISRSPTTLTFSNSAYTVNTASNSTFVELTSALSDHSTNVFRANYNYVNNNQNTAPFPSININDGGLIYNLGSDYTSAANSLAQKDFDLVDNFTVYKGRHAFTFGSDNEFLTLRNVYLPSFNGYYVYNSVAAFENNASPVNYSVGYSTKGGADNAAAVMRAGQLSVYGQDVWAVNERLNLIYGLRTDVPVFFNKPAGNAAFNSSAIASAFNVATNQTPKLRPEFSPRAGFNYDVYGDRTTQLRGGAGIFTGDVPYIWMSNQYAYTGVNSIKFTGVPGGLTFNYKPGEPHLGAYIPLNSTAAPTEIDITDPNFKLPQQLHANLAVDRTLPYGFVGTFEILYSKTISDILYRNLNVGGTEGSVSLGSTMRPYYNFKYTNTSYADVIELTNTNEGHAYDFTLRLRRPFTDGWSAMGAYTLGHSYSVNDGTGSTAIVNWRTAYAANGSNNPGESNSNFDLGSRIISYFSKTFFPFKNSWQTTLSVVYSGQTGQRYSYLYNYNITGDDISNRYTATNLVYIPTEAGQFASFNRVVNGETTVVTPAQQLADLQAFMADNPSLQKYTGKNTPRNGFTLPWESHFDLRIAESLPAVKNRKLQFGISFVNVANLLYKYAGQAYYLPNHEYSLFNVVNTSAAPLFTFDKTKLNIIDGHLRAYAVDPYNSEWRIQLDLHYSF